MKLPSALFFFFLVLWICYLELGFSSQVIKMSTTGGIRESEAGGTENSVEIEELAKFAVEEHNKKENALLEFARVVKAKTQVVAGSMHHLTLEVVDAGKKVLYEAKVWVKPWENFKQLKEFKHAGDSAPAVTPSDLGVRQGVSSQVLKMSGGIRESEAGVENSVEIEELAKFAVEEHNKKENALLEFARVVKAKTQVVAGTMHHLTLEVVDAGKKVLYEAKVWVKPWENFKQLKEFKHAGDSAPAVTPSDLGVKRDGHEPGWRTVPAHDPAVKDAADHAVKTIQQRSNSLAPFELLEIILAKAEVIDEMAKFDLLLKMKRGNKEEKYKVEVHRNLEGTFHLNQMEQDHS